MDDFYLSLYKGNIFKELVKALFEKSRYVAIPYGYENPFSNIKKSLAEKNFESCSETAKRIRCSPDLLIYDDQTRDVMLVEVKMSSYETPQIKRIEYYRRYWEDAVIVIVSPFENVFYTQEISKLGVKGYYDLKSDFKRIQEFFPKISPVDMSAYQNMARKMIQVTKTLSRLSDEEQVG